MKALLVSNYFHDGQESMLRFAEALRAGLLAEGVDTGIVRPEPLFGRLRPGASGLGKWLGYLDKFCVFPRRLRRLARGADVVHICDHSNAMYVPLISARPHLVTCNDMLAIRSARGEFPQNRTGWTGRILQRWILSGLRRARRLTCISEATRRDVLRLTGHPPEIVSVTFMGQNFAYAPVAEISRAVEARRRGEPPNAGIFSRHGLPTRPYLLHVGGAQWYKNRRGALAIHAALRRRFGQETPDLVLVGPPLARPMPGVETRQRVDNATLAALYTGAELLLFPSLEEGFGWPIIEAQACGCRVLTTGRAPMTEAGGTAAFYLADPNDAEAGAARIMEMLAQDEEARGKAGAAGIANAARFSASRMATEYAALYREALKT
jgi:glycosyltransferase involved in cell wall biosynthesis